MSTTAGPRPRAASSTADRLAAVSTAPAALFTYGTLMFDEILRVLLGRIPASAPATVEGWRAVAIPGCSYPALVTGTTRAAGRLLLDLQPDEWQVLDAYEDDIYELRPLPIGPAGYQAFAYVSSAAAGAGDTDWDRDRFATGDLAAYIDRCAEWRQRTFPGAVDGR
jgi:hypothetical protein